MNALKNLIRRIRGEVSTQELIKRGLKVGNNFERLNQVIIDDSHPWLIEIGNDVTLAPRVHILAHDASTKKYLGYTKIGCVTVGNRVFVGAGAIILPGVRIGDDVIIGANSTVTHDVPNGAVVVGSPAKYICNTKDYIEKEKQRMKDSYCYGEAYTMRENITEGKKRQQKDELKDGSIGYVV